MPFPLNECCDVCRRPPAKLARVKAIVDESSMFSITTPSVAQLTEALKSVQSWLSKVAALSVCGNVICQCMSFPVYMRSSLSDSVVNVMYFIEITAILCTSVTGIQTVTPV